MFEAAYLEQDKYLHTVRTELVAEKINSTTIIITDL